MLCINQDTMKCSGYDVVTRERIEIEFDSVISHVDPVLEDGDEEIFVAPDSSIFR